VAGDVIVEALNEGTDLVRVALASGTYTLGSNLENAIVTSAAAVGITGNALDNLLTGNAMANTLTGSGGNDTLDGAAGGDRLVGGTGDDRYIVNMASDVIVEALSEGLDSVDVSFTAAGTYVLSANVENALVTNALNVNLTGNADANLLTGGDGANLLSGLGGNDTLVGGLGKDTLTGGAGADRFVFSTAPSAGNVDTITDFQSGVDVIALSASVYSALGAAGNTVGLSANLTYNSTTGILAYDADGAAGDPAVQIALLGVSTHPASLGAAFLLI
jgi:serralysin